VEDRISRGLQHRHEMCCEKGGHHGRQACTVRRWFHHGNVISRQVDLYMTRGLLVKFSCNSPTLYLIAHWRALLVVRSFVFEVMSGCYNSVYHRTSKHYTAARMQGLVIDSLEGRICRSCKTK